MLNKFIISLLFVFLMTTSSQAFDEILLNCKLKKINTDKLYVLSRGNITKLSPPSEIYAEDTLFSINENGCAFVNSTTGIIGKRWGSVEILDKAIICHFLRAKYNFNKSETYFKKIRNL